MYTGKIVALLVSSKKTVNTLTLTTDHPASHYGLGVMLDEAGDVFSGAKFRFLQEEFGYSLETTHPVKVQRALGLPTTKGITCTAQACDTVSA